MKIDIVVPVYNECLFIETFLKDLTKAIRVLPIRKVIIVDDGSTDQTSDIVKKYTNHNITLIQYAINHGKGYAMRIGFESAQKAKADAVIFMDGDRQHNPKHLSKFIEALDAYQIVLGYRRLDKKAPYFRKLGNKIAHYLFRIFFNIKRHDILCGFMAIRKDVYDDIVWKSDDYGVEMEISAIIGKKRTIFKEVLIDTVYLDMKKGVTLKRAFFISLKIPYWYFNYR